MLPSTWRGFAVALARKAARIRRVWRARSPSLSAGFSLSLSLSFSVRVHLQLSGCRRGCEHILEKVCPWSVLLISINCFIWVGGLLPRVIDLTFVIVLKLLKPTSSWIFFTCSKQVYGLWLAIHVVVVDMNKLNWCRNLLVVSQLSQNFAKFAGVEI